ncbi:Mn-containing catalase [Paludicola sp. MB14-C6]|uniref:Mn-containing catalase n=1 Tax=Paludihabitans sp. MB14-C6 TaxID=3070656 RepID=UPI0027DB4C21|nr:Mn-containing catalase [Paludicola sp. MB14-C6]WMJ22930.1 Mn-containing catalase [Paludicola sp. MB14-C6]
MICAIVYQLTRNLTVDEIKRSGFAPYYVDHTTGLYPVAASGEAFSASALQSTGDPIADLVEDLAADGAIMQEQQMPYFTQFVWKLAPFMTNQLTKY